MGIMDAFPVVRISPRAATQIRRGHLWVFANEVDMSTAPKEPGTWCHFGANEKIAGTGYFNSHSLIAGRIVATLAHDDIGLLLRSRVRAAFEQRTHLLTNGSARLVFSESDLLPGLIVDWYDGTLVIQSNTAGIDHVRPLLETVVPEEFRAIFSIAPSAMVFRADSSIRRLELLSDSSAIVFGDREAIVNATFKEGDVVYAANLLEGQKTGFFLDQRDNRQFLGSYVTRHSGAQVLDLFCYSGGWGLRALRAGARSVTFVDQSGPALELVRHGCTRNGFVQNAVEYVESDAFDFLSGSTHLYDVIIADPPAFVKSKKNLPQARKAYEKLNRLCWKRLKPGGLLLSCSCSHHISDEDFIAILAASVGKEEGRAQVIFRGGQPSDHPVLLSMPETRYLKCLGLRKIDVN